jgi:hypothetical protein
VSLAVQLFAVSSGVAIAYVIALFAVIFIGPSWVVALKGQWALFDAGFTWSGFVWWIAAFRLARPESWWARHLYGAKKLARAEVRYPESLDEEEESE